jgi:FtsH-binding integral membrane protein
VRYTSLLNYLFYQAGWFACVLGAAAGRPWLGFLLAATLVGAHLWLAGDRLHELRRVALAVAVGGLVEAVQIAAGTYHFTSGTVMTGLPPPWLLIMWAQMATTFDFSLRPIVSRPVAAMAFGALGGPLAFLAGERLGAVTLQRPLGPGLLLLAISWAFAMTVFAFVEQRDARRHPPA